MKGLIYKESCLFFKSIDKKVVLIAAAAIALLLFRTGEYAGLLSTVMLSMSIGMQSVLAFANDEKVSWKSYQLTMPIKNCYAVGSKYISVLFTLILSLGTSILLSLLTGVIYRHFDPALLLLSAALAILIPVLWSAIFLPLVYWFGIRSAQTLGLLGVFPIFYLIKYFEDGPGLLLPSNTLPEYLFAGFGISAAAFILSYFISVLGYSQRR